MALDRRPARFVLADRRRNRYLGGAADGSNADRDRTKIPFGQRALERCRQPPHPAARWAGRPFRRPQGAGPVFYDDRATLTIKGPRRGLTRDEFEYEIPACDDPTLLEQHCSDDVLEKTRHHVPFDGFDRVVDEYHGSLAGVFVAEVELPEETSEFSSPPRLGIEVTGNKRYRKVNMLRARPKMVGTVL